MVRFARWVSFPAIFLALTACGGGGGGGAGGHDLTLSFSYGGGALSLFSNARAVPSISGLEGHSPSCSLGSGNLPPGLKLGGDCVISGNPTSIGTYNASIRLEVDGFGGAVSAPVSFGVLEPLLRPAPIPNSSSLIQNINLGQAIDHLQIVSLSTGLGSYSPEAGDRLNYQVVSGALPVGLSLDALSGTINGRTTAYGPTIVGLSLTITHGGTAFTTSPTLVTIQVNEAPWTVFYGAIETCCVKQLGDIVNLVPVSTYQAIEGATVEFKLQGKLPGGLTLDPITGVVSGRLTTTSFFADYVANVSQIVTLPGGAGTLQANSSTLNWNITGPNFSFQYYSQQTFSGQAFSFTPGQFSGLLPGDIYTFSLAPLQTPNATPIPSWLSIDPITGVVSGIGVAPVGYGDRVLCDAVMTVTRGGFQYPIRRFMEIFLN